METTKKQKQGFKGIEAAGLVIIACFIVAFGRSFELYEQ